MPLDRGANGYTYYSRGALRSIKRPLLLQVAVRPALTVGMPQRGEMLQTIRAEIPYWAVAMSSGWQTRMLNSDQEWLLWIPKRYPAWFVVRQKSWLAPMCHGRDFSLTSGAQPIDRRVAVDPPSGVIGVGHRTSSRCEGNASPGADRFGIQTFHLSSEGDDFLHDEVPHPAGGPHVDFVSSHPAEERLSDRRSQRYLACVQIDEAPGEERVGDLLAA